MEDVGSMEGSGALKALSLLAKVLAEKTFSPWT